MRSLFRHLAATLAILSATAFVYGGFLAARLPQSYYMTPSSSAQLGRGLSLRSEESSFVETLGGPKSRPCNSQVMMMNAIPIKQVHVDHINELRVVPCGTPFGVKIFTLGLMVVGTSDIKTAQGSINPAKNAGLKSGDVILTVSGKKLHSNEELSEMVRHSGSAPMNLEVSRNDVTYTTQITPAKSADDNEHRVGLWVRDSSAGIGTMTFFDPKTKIFGGLGHGICDVDTGELLPLAHGDIVRATVNGFTKGAKGTPGELKGYFFENETTGNLIDNTYSGLYGQLKGISGFEGDEIPIAVKQQVKVGPAQILTTIAGTTPKAYNVEIQSLNFNEDAPSKNMIIKIVDEGLVSQTGGIVQGMSGSPILQDNRIVGAVTHVFVNEPQKGYGIFAENMLDKIAQITASKEAA